MESVGESVQLPVVYAFGGEGVDAYLAGRMDDEIVAHVDAYMDNSALVIAEEAEVVAPAFTYVAYGVALCGLL